MLAAVRRKPVTALSVLSLQTCASHCRDKRECGMFSKRNGVRNSFLRLRIGIACSHLPSQSSIKEIGNVRIEEIYVFAVLDHERSTGQRSLGQCVNENPCSVPGLSHSGHMRLEWQILKPQSGMEGGLIALWLEVPNSDSYIREIIYCLHGYVILTLFYI